MESLKRLGGVLWGPTATFQKIGERPTWGVVLVVLLVLAGALGYLAVQKIDPDAQRQMMEETFEERMGLRGDALEEQVDQAMGWNRRIAPWTPLFGVAFAVLAYLVVALLFWVAFRLAGGELAFPQSFSVALHAFVPLGLAALIAIPVLLGQETIDPEAAQRGSFLASNLGFLAPEDASGTVVSLLSSLDLFTVWSVVLLVIGYSVVARVSKGVGAGIVGAAWVVWIGIKVGIAALFT
jgi:hypothetical protein